MDVDYTANDDPVVTHLDLASHFASGHCERVAMQKR
jgi:hypothetical protein